MSLADLINDIFDAIMNSPLNFKIKKSKERLRREKIRDNWVQNWHGDPNANNHHDTFGG